MIDFYNHNMGSVDIADQLRNHYRYDTQWHRNRKWWWAIWWWGFQVLLTNSYKVYCDFHKIHQSNKALSHYEFIKSVALAWLDKENYWPKQRRRKRTSLEMDDETDTSLVMKNNRTRRNLNSTSCSTTCSTAAPSSSAESQSSKSTNETMVWRNATINDKAVDPNGSLKCCLNAYVHHSPCPSTNKRAKCQLH